MICCNAFKPPVAALCVSATANSTPDASLHGCHCYYCCCSATSSVLRVAVSCVWTNKLLPQDKSANGGVAFARKPEHVGATWSTAARASVFASKRGPDIPAFFLLAVAFGDGLMVLDVLSHGLVVTQTHD